MRKAKMPVCLCFVWPPLLVELRLITVEVHNA